MRKKIVAGNWKMNKTAAEAFVLATEVAQLVKSEVPSDVQVIMATPALYLTGVSQVVEGIENLAVAAQNCHTMSLDYWESATATAVTCAPDFHCKWWKSMSQCGCCLWSKPHPRLC